MKEIKAIVAAYDSIDLHTTRAAMATVVRVEGSSYRRTGARMLVLDDGTYLGGISGGCLEGDALRKALKAIQQNKPSIVTYDTTQDDDHQVGVGLGCNGIIDVLFTPLDAASDNNPLHLLRSLISIRKPAILVTITDCGSKPEALAQTVLYQNDEQFLEEFALSSLASSVLNDLHHCMDEGRSASNLYEGENSIARVFIERIAPSIRLLIYGNYYDMQPLARIAKELGWETIAITNRSKASKELFKYAEVVDRLEETRISTDAYSAAVLMNHDLATDGRQLKILLDTDISYIGLLGPRKRSLRLMETLDAPADAEDRIFAPAGLDIGALSPEEIALSIAAEIQGCFAGKQGTSLRLKQGSIHESK